MPKGYEGSNPSSPANIAQWPSGKAQDFDSCIRWFESILGNQILNKEKIIMTRLAIENRIALLEGREKDNRRIIMKLQRKLRKIDD